MASSSSKEDSQNGAKVDMNAIVDQAIAFFQERTRHYKEKARENHILLEKIGFDINCLPQELKKEIEDILKDNEVFNFHSLDSKELVTVNAQHVIDSLGAADDQARVHRLKVQADTVVQSLEDTNKDLHRKLEIATLQSEYLEDKANEITAQTMVFKGKLEQATRELKELQEKSEALEQPKHSQKDLVNLNKKLKSVKEKIALTETKLEKYNGLSLYEEEAAKQLAKLQEKLQQVEKEIAEKLKSQ